MQAATRLPDTPACPFHANEDATMIAGLQPGDRLSLPLHQRLVRHYSRAADGARTLHLYHGDKEISFDEPALFAFGEQLGRQEHFTAEDAVGWGEGYTWPQVGALLGQLVEEGVLHRDDGRGDDTALAADLALDRPSPLPPGPNTRPRSWADCQSITRELTGVALEPGWLELVVPVFRVAHMALDADGRQVGESNVFPPAMRLDLPTRWRTCIYPGTRYRVDRPMNVTALKAMRRQWPQMMLALREVRRAYLARCPEAGAGWTVGHLERLATAVLAVPTLALVHPERPVADGELHPALSSLFRVTDGLRMTMHQMLFVPIGEPTLAPDAPMDSAEILAYAERNHSFHSAHGVCAGPQAMMAEFLAVLVDGALPAGADDVTADPALRQALDDVEMPMDYAFLGLQAYAEVFSLWPKMTRAYEGLLPLVRDWAACGGDDVIAWQARLEGQIEAVRHGTYLANEAWRVDRERVYADMAAQCGRALGDSPDPLGQRLAEAEPADVAHLQQQLAPLLRQRMGRPDASDGPALQAVARHLARWCLQEQAVLRAATATQARINRLLGRPAPRRPFGSTEIDLHNALQGDAPRRLPDLVAELSLLLGTPVVIEPDVVRLGPAAVPFGGTA